MRLTYIFLFVPLFYMGAPLFSQTGIVPKMTIELAIERAKNYAADKEIDLRSKFIKKVEYHNNTKNRNERSYWQVYWINERATKGGGVELRLFSDGSVEEKYYK